LLDMRHDHSALEVSGLGVRRGMNQISNPQMEGRIWALAPMRLGNSRNYHNQIKSTASKEALCNQHCGVEDHLIKM